MKLKPIPFQRGVLKEMEACNGRILLALHTGLGKTLCSLKYMHKHKIWPTLVVCPNGVKDGWESTARNHFNVSADVLEGKKPSRWNTMHRKLVIVNYDIVFHWVEYLASIPFKGLILDETQRLGNQATQCTTACTYLSEGIETVLGLSATPLLNRPKDLWPTLHIIWPDKYPSFWPYAEKYCAPKMTHRGWDYRGASNLPALHRELVANGMIRRLKKDVLKDFPTKKRKIIALRIKQRNKYDQAEIEYASWAAAQFQRLRLTKTMKAKQLTQMNNLRMLTARLKLPAVIRWINKWLEDHPNEKMLVFGVHHKMVEALHRYYAHNSVLLYGKTNKEKRRIAIARFKQSKMVRLFIANIQAAGVGLDGLQVASNVAIVELPWRPGDITQAEDRAHRIGTTEKVKVYFLIARDTIEDRICRINQVKQSNISTVLDGSASVSSLNIYDQLTKEIMEAHGITQPTRVSRDRVSKGWRTPKRPARLDRN